MFINQLLDALFNVVCPAPVPKPVPVPVRVTQRPRQDCQRIRFRGGPAYLDMHVVPDEEFVRRHGHEMP
jgi:hypothetical protein